MLGRMSWLRSKPKEGWVARFLDRRAGNIPSDVFLWAAGASIIASLTLRIRRREEDAIFIGQWAPVLLILGLYTKLVKLLGSG